MNRYRALWCAPLLLTGCYTTTIHSGLPASPATVAYDQRWHHGLFAGIAELSSPYDLSQACPRGWSEIETEQSFLNGLLALIGGGYTSQTVTIRCAAVPVTVSATRPEQPLAASAANPSPAPTPSPAEPQPQSTPPQ
jgi:hypothetical protein